MKLNTTREDRPFRAVLTMSIAVVAFTLIDTSAKWLILSGLPAIQVIFARYCGHFIGALLLFLPREGLDALRSNRPGVQLLRSAMLLTSTALNFFALSYLPITVTTAIAFAGPIVISILAIPILGEQVGLRRFIAVMVGFFGVIVVIQPWGADFHWAMGLSLLSLLSASTYFVLTRMLAGQEANSTSQIWSSALATMVLLPLVLQVWEWPETITGYAVLGVIGLFGLLGHTLATGAHRMAEASTLAPVVYLQVIYATAAGYFVFDSLPTKWTVAGTAIIVCSGIYILHRERRLARERRVPIIR
jgi:drug/metabolite transporter (DMT)-like permease